MALGGRGQSGLARGGASLACEVAEQIRCEVSLRGGMKFCKSR